MEKAILKNRKTGGQSKNEEVTLRKKGEKAWEGIFGFNGVMGGT